MHKQDTMNTFHHMIYSNKLLLILIFKTTNFIFLKGLKVCIKNQAVFTMLNFPWNYNFH